MMLMSAAIWVPTPLLAEGARDEQSYVVTVKPDAAMDGTRTVAGQLAASYGGVVTDPGTTNGEAFVIRLSETGARLVAADPRVHSVAPMQPSRAVPDAVEAVSWTGGVSYTYEGSGNVTQIGGDPFRYDTAGRLVQTTVNSVRRTYDYDAFGNRQACTQISANDCQLVTINAVENRNRIKEANYDGSGNVTTLGQHGYSYDALNMLMRDDSQALTREFVYTADDERIATYTVGSSWRWTIRDTSGKVLREFSSQDGPAGPGTGAWKWEKDYVWRAGLLLASRQPEGQSTTTYHYHLDHLGTPRRVTDQNDRIIGVHDYFAFGPETSGGTAERSLTALKYTGHERDSVMGNEFTDTLDYMHARFYTATMGRFLSVDAHPGTPAAPQSWNRYAYARGNPLKYTDPNGKDIQLAGANANAVVTFLVRTARHPQGRADLAAIARNHNFVATYHDEPINSPQQIANIQAAGGRFTLAVTSPDHTSRATSVDVAIDTNAVAVLHPTDRSGVTTIEHEHNHVIDLMNNVPYNQIVATDTTGSAEAYGASVAASPTDMTQQEAENYVTTLLLPPEPPQTLTDIQNRLPPEE
jgi:RHS repeat-associated protein